MTQLDATESDATTRGELRFVEPSTLAQLRGVASAASRLYIEVPFLSAALRGQLGEFLDAAVEEELARRGAPRTGLASEGAAELQDQLLRARSLGFRGLVIAVGPLQSLAGPAGVLDPEDSAALRFWGAASSRLPVTLLLDRRNLSLAGYGAPQRLDALLGWSEPPAERPARSLPRPAPAAPAPPEPGEAPQCDWRLFAEELHAARGPKPLGVVERMFITRYLPLADAEIRGQLDTFARQARADWASSFARSYNEAFHALRVTGKRPAMVFDVPQLASRIARLHGARSVELLLIDGMRYDLGLRVLDRLRLAFEGKAACAESLLLWSALPSTTTTQLDLLAHGQEALTRPASEEADTATITRGRNVCLPRRVKIGARDLMKIDAVEARMRESGPPLLERFEQIADEVTHGVLRHAETLPERTLLMIFGDHGFVVDSVAGGSGPARQGGASPEEVLVPGFAWLLGGVHLRRGSMQGCAPCTAVVGRFRGG